MEAVLDPTGSEILRLGGFSQLLTFMYRAKSYAGHHHPQLSLYKQKEQSITSRTLEGQVPTAPSSSMLIFPSLLLSIWSNKFVSCTWQLTSRLLP